MPTILNLVEKHKTIERIDLEGNKLDDGAVQGICKIIKSTATHVWKIDLRFNKITADGAWRITMAIMDRFANAE